jgi:endonuclease/exonuclease/phosphatase family metal-dependent hydrolase
MTSNIWARSGPYRDRAPLLRREVGLLAPDLLALQEVEAGPGAGGQAEELFGPLGYEIVYERRDGSYVGDPGVAVASRYPVLDRRLIELPHNGPCLAVRVESPHGPLWFASAVPMGGWPHQEGQREDEAVALDEALNRLAAGDDLPPVLAGDFDAAPDSASIRFLTGLQSLQGRSTGWVDAWAAAGDGSPGHTWSTTNAHAAPFIAAVFAQPVHHRRIDYVFVGSPFVWRPRVVVRSCQVVMTAPQSCPPSDHYGVVADLDVDGVVLGEGRGLETWDTVAATLWPPEPNPS